jgi:diacylglycerol O-acyltransferase / wax synthase
MADGMRFEHRMSDADALMWSIEKDPLLRSTITAVAVMDQAPDRGRLRERLDRASRLVPRLRQRVRSNPLSLAPPRWETDPNFDLDYHLRWMRAPGDGSLRDVLDVAQPIAMQGFDRARPLWELAVVEGLEDGRAAIILKLHHSITDGVGAVKIGMVLFDLERDPVVVEESMPDAPDPRVWNQIERTWDAVQHEVRRQVGIVGRAAARTRRTLGDPAQRVRDLRAGASSVARVMAPATAPLSPIMRKRSLSVHFDGIAIPLDDAKAAAKAAGGRLNDAFVAATVGGLRKYHQHHGQPVDSLRMTMPINVRTGDNEDLAGNQFAPARFPVPLTIDDPRERMRVLRELVATQRAEPAMALVDPLAGVLNRLPTSLTTALFGSMLKGVDFVTSNVPGVPIPVFLAGARMESQFAFGPMSGAAANITLLSYVDQAFIAVNSDPAAVPDPDVLKACLVDGWDEIIKSAG